jgi:hypothetical protein
MCSYENHQLKKYFQDILNEQLHELNKNKFKINLEIKLFVTIEKFHIQKESINERNQKKLNTNSNIIVKDMKR